MKLLIPIVAAVAMADERGIDHTHVTLDAVPEKVTNFVENRVPIVNNWKPVNGEVKYVDNAKFDNGYRYPYYNGVRYNNQYANQYANGYYNNFNNGLYNNGYRYNTGYRTPYVHNSNNKFVDKVIEKVENIIHHDDHDDHDDLGQVESFQPVTYGKLYGKPFFGNQKLENVENVDNKYYSSVTGKYYNRFQNNAEKVVEQEVQRPFYNYIQRPVQQVYQQFARPIQQVYQQVARPIQQVARPVQYVQQPKKDFDFNSFLNFYVMKDILKDDDVEELD
jgi:hypothetical protein